MDTLDYYYILGVDSNATNAQIKRAFHTRAIETHPDKNGNTREATDAFQQIMTAWECLRDPIQRKAYDRTYIPMGPSSGLRSQTPQPKTSSSIYPEPMSPNPRSSPNSGSRSHCKRTRRYSSTSPTPTVPSIAELELEASRFKQKWADHMRLKAELDNMETMIRNTKERIHETHIQIERCRQETEMAKSRGWGSRHQARWIEEVERSNADRINKMNYTLEALEAHLTATLSDRKRRYAGWVVKEDERRFDEQLLEQKFKRRRDSERLAQKDRQDADEWARIRREQAERKRQQEEANAERRRWEEEQRAREAEERRRVEQYWQERAAAQEQEARRRERDQAAAAWRKQSKEAEERLRSQRIQEAELRRQKRQELFKKAKEDEAKKHEEDDKTRKNEKDEEEQKKKQQEIERKAREEERAKAAERELLLRETIAKLLRQQGKKPGKTRRNTASTPNASPTASPTKISPASSTKKSCSHKPAWSKQTTNASETCVGCGEASKGVMFECPDCNVRACGKCRDAMKAK